MASQGPNSGSTFADDATVGTTAWATPGNANTSDNVYATCTLGGFAVGHYLKATGFGFSIPADASIDGILVEVEQKAPQVNAITDNSIKLVKAGVIGGTDNPAETPWPTADAYASFGSASDLWGLAWTPTDINSATFGFVVSVKNDTGLSRVVSCDHIRITVFYTPALVRVPPNPLLMR